MTSEVDQAALRKPDQKASGRISEGDRGTQRARVLFLGNSYNSLSVKCLQSLTESGHDITVGCYDPLSAGTWRFARRRLKSRGWILVLHKGLRWVRSKARLNLRRLGVPLSGFASVPELVRACGLNMIRCSDPNGAEFVERVRRLAFDLIVVASFSRILKKALLAVPRLGCVNVHPSLLPSYRGPEPFYWVLAKGETTTGVTVHHIDEAIDSGDIVLQREFAILPKETARTLEERCAEVGAALLSEALPLLLTETAPRVPQDSSLASYYSFPPRGAALQNCTQRVPPPSKAHGSIRTIDPLEDPRWAALVNEHPNASIFHTVPWLRALQRTYGYEPVVYTTSPSNCALQNGVAFCRVQSWVTGRRLVSLPFSDHCEPLIDSDGELEAILGYLRADHRSNDWKYVEVRPLNGGLGQTYGRQGFQTSEQYYLHTVDLRPAEDQLLHGFHKTSIQQRIHRAEREGVEYESGRSGEFLAKFYPLMLRTRRRHQIPPPPMAWFRNLMECMGDALAIHIASYRNTAVASILTLRFRDTTFYKYAGSDPGYHKLGPMPFLLWRAIREAKANDIRIFDLGRSDSHQQGLVDFKDHWAGERKFVTYWRWPIRRKNFWMNDGAAFRVAGHFFELLPNSMLKAAGELLYRHIG